MSEETFEDFELIYEAKPDWPADTGVYIRADETGTCGYQILLDHRKSGSIGGFYGNAIGGFHAINWHPVSVPVSSPRIWHSFSPKRRRSESALRSFDAKCFQTCRKVLSRGREDGSRCHAVCFMIRL